MSDPNGTNKPVTATPPPLPTGRGTRRRMSSRNRSEDPPTKTVESAPRPPPRQDDNDGDASAATPITTDFSVPPDAPPGAILPRGDGEHFLPVSQALVLSGTDRAEPDLSYNVVAAAKTPVHAVCGGVLASVSADAMTLAAKDGRQFQYCGLKPYLQVPGEAVEAGQVVGVFAQDGPLTLAATGTDGAPVHLHMLLLGAPDPGELGYRLDAARLSVDPEPGDRSLIQPELPVATKTSPPAIAVPLSGRSNGRGGSDAADRKAVHPSDLVSSAGRASTMRVPEPQHAAKPAVAPPSRIRPAVSPEAEMSSTPLQPAPVGPRAAEPPEPTHVAEAPDSKDGSESTDAETSTEVSDAAERRRRALARLVAKPVDDSDPAS